MPRNLGPIIPVIDNGDTENDGTKLIERVAWRHEAGQECSRWEPVNEKKYVFPEYRVESLTDDHRGVAIGPHSLCEDMSMVYTCEQQMCRVGCSCKICRTREVIAEENVESFLVRIAQINARFIP